MRDLRIDGRIISKYINQTVCDVVKIDGQNEKQVDSTKKMTKRVTKEGV